MDRKKGFICYAHADKPMFEEVRRQLTALESAFPIDFWNDPSLRGGDLWDTVIKAEVAAADLFLLLFTPNWFSSDYIQKTELPAILSRAQAAGSQIVPVILRGCRWQARFGEFQAVPTDKTGAILPVMNWHRRHDGYERVAEQIEGVLQDRMHLKSVPLTPPETLRGFPQDKGGAIWIKQDAAFVIVTGGDLSDARTAQDTTVRQLHDRLRDMAGALAERLAVPATDPDISVERSSIAERASALAEGLAIETDAVPGRIADLYSMIQTLGGSRDALRRLREVRVNAPDPLSPGEYADLNDLVTQAALWIRQFPRARDLDAGSVIPSDLPCLIPLVRTFIMAAQYAHLIDDTDANDVMAPLGEATGAPMEAQSRAVLGARNLLYRLGIFALGFIPQPVLPGDAADDGIADAVGGVLVEEASGITEFLRGAPGEVGAAFGRLIAISRESGLRAPATLPLVAAPLSMELPVDFNLDEVKRRILAAEDVPAAWVPFVTKLDLSFTPLSNATPLGALTALDSLNLWCTQVVDVTPLGALTRLRSLNLTDTPVKDLAPLCNLADLRVLLLRHTRVRDVTVLGLLTTLNTLGLGNTSIMYLPELGSLAALQSLDLCDTPLSDLTPLVGLKALRSLDLTGTWVIDITPLSRLTELRSLSLRSTKVSDVTPLTSLKALQELDLTGTRPAGVDALRRPGLKIRGGPRQLRPLHAGR